jgi:hypothetical protein
MQIERINEILDLEFGIWDFKSFRIIVMLIVGMALIVSLLTSAYASIEKVRIGVFGMS